MAECKFDLLYGTEPFVFVSKLLSIPCGIFIYHSKALCLFNRSIIFHTTITQSVDREDPPKLTSSAVLKNRLFARFSKTIFSTRVIILARFGTGCCRNQSDGSSVQSTHNKDRWEWSVWLADMMTYAIWLNVKLALSPLQHVHIYYLDTRRRPGCGWLPYTYGVMTY